MKKIVITALALSMLGGSAFAASVKSFSVVVAKGTGTVSVSSSVSGSVSSGGSSSVGAKGTANGSSGGVFLGTKSNGTWTFTGCTAPCSTSLH